MVFSQVGLYHIFSGGLILGAFFMARLSYIAGNTYWSDYYGYRLWYYNICNPFAGGYPGGVSYSILIMNVATPLIERYTRPQYMGEVKTMSDIMKIGFRLFIITVIAAIVMGITNIATEEPIRLQRIKAENKARQAALPGGGF